MPSTLRPPAAGGAAASGPPRAAPAPSPAGPDCGTRYHLHICRCPSMRCCVAGAYPPPQWAQLADQPRLDDLFAAATTDVNMNAVARATAFCAFILMLAQCHVLHVKAAPSRVPVAEQLREVRLLSVRIRRGRVRRASPAAAALQREQPRRGAGVRAARRERTAQGS